MCLLTRSFSNIVYDATYVVKCVYDSVQTRLSNIFLPSQLPGVSHDSSCSSRCVVAAGQKLTD